MIMATAAVRHQETVDCMNLKRGKATVSFALSRCNIGLSKQANAHNGLIERFLHAIANFSIPSFFFFSTESNAAAAKPLSLIPKRVDDCGRF